MKATDLLKKQHREVDQLFARIESAQNESEKESLREELANKLVAHSAIEREIFYPAVSKAIEGEQRFEALQEHSLIEVALQIWFRASGGDDKFDAQATVLKEMVEHHVEEEQNELFPKVERAMGAERLEQLGQQLEMMFEESVETGYEQLLERALEREGIRVGASRAGRSAKRPRRATTPRARTSGKQASSRGRSSRSKGANGKSSPAGRRASSKSRATTSGTRRGTGGSSGARRQTKRGARTSGRQNTTKSRATRKSGRSRKTGR